MFTNKISNLYNNLTYYDLNGANISISILTFLILLGLIVYFYIQINIKPIKKNWIKYRCNPLFMPFAGYINKPKNKSALDYTDENFSFCLTEILRETTKIATIPITYIESGILTLEKVIIDVIEEIMKILGFIKAELLRLLAILLGKINNVLISMQKDYLALSDLFHRSGSIFVVLIKFLETVWNSIGSIFDELWSAIVDFFDLLYGLVDGIFIAAISMMDSVFGFFLGLATAAGGLIALQVITTLATPLQWIGDILRGVFSNNSPKIHNAAIDSIVNKVKHVMHCFAKNTIIQLDNNVSTVIQYIKPGDTLHDKSIVTSVMKLDSTDQEFYILDGTIVTGSHKVLYNNHWIYVKSHPKACKIKPLNEPIYCLNTSNKVIKINNTTFSDWDDLETIDIDILNTYCSKHLSNTLTFSTIHKYLEPGLAGNTPIKLKNGSLIAIDKIRLYDSLYDNNKVIGIVTIHGKNIDIYKYNINNNIITGTKNLQYTINNQLVNLLTLQTSKCSHSGYLYHLLTSDGYFYINNTKFHDYNYGLEMYF